VAIGFSAGTCNQNAQCIAIGTEAGASGQAVQATAIGYNAGLCHQGYQSTAIGFEAGECSQLQEATAIGFRAGMSDQQVSALAIGFNAGRVTQGSEGIAIGRGAGESNQQTRAVAIGGLAGFYTQGSYSIALGYQAGHNGVSTQHDRSIVMNASGAPLQSAQTDSCFIRPIRDVDSTGAQSLCYEPTTGEVFRNTNAAKTFVIDHPLDPRRKHLVHGCLEGPEGGVYYRGKCCINEDVELPDYVRALVAHGDIPTIQVTPCSQQTYSLWVTPWSRETNSFRVNGGEGEAFWTFFAKRCDVQTSVLKSRARVRGEGPYTYIAST